MKTPESAAAAASAADAAEGAKGLRASVVYALADRQSVVNVNVPPGTTVGSAIERSGLLERHRELRAAPLEAGIFHRRCALDTAVRDGDRIEIYRPLRIDPKEARRLRSDPRRGRRRAPAATGDAAASPGDAEP
jgi:putative ubiquitin-RnfH superfamily antitoxin RatB of RatAB toxin-antitoxin module